MSLETFKVLCDHLLHVVVILQVRLRVPTLVIASAIELPLWLAFGRLSDGHTGHRLQPVVICLLDDLRDRLLLANTLRDEAHDLWDQQQRHRCRY